MAAARSMEVGLLREREAKWIEQITPKQRQPISSDLDAVGPSHEIMRLYLVSSVMTLTVSPPIIRGREPEAGLHAEQAGRKQCKPILRDFEQCREPCPRGQKTGAENLE